MTFIVKGKLQANNLIKFFLKRYQEVYSIILCLYILKR